MGATRSGGRGRRWTIAALALGLLGTTPTAAAEAAEPAENAWLVEHRVANIAHQGGAHEAPAETPYALKTAIDRGADVLEFDVMITRDAHLVTVHDTTVNRTTNGTGCIVDHTLDELKALDAAYRFVPGFGARAGEPDDAYVYRGVATGDVPPPEGYSAEDFTVATLDEVIDLAPDALMNIEMKVNTGACLTSLQAIPEAERPDLVAELARTIDEHDLDDQVLVASFDQATLTAFKALAPDVDTTFSLAEALQLYVDYTNGQPLANPAGHAALQVPTSYGGIVITEELVAAARAAGIAVHFWTINDAATMETLLDWGVDGIITDRPQVLDEVLTARGEPRPGDPSDPEEPEDPETPPLPDDAQMPFLCTTEAGGLGQPIVDNQDKRGTPVYPLLPSGQPDRSQDPLGWSEWCQAEAKVEYRYRTTSGALRTLAPGATTLPADIAYLDTADLIGADQMDLDGADQIPFLLRYERGTLPTNRFLYSIAMLVPWEAVRSGSDATDPSTAHWNGRLVYSFNGGVGIGHSQGGLSSGASTLPEAMRLGHAVLYSSGTSTGLHYNLKVGGRAAVEAKDLFVDEHGAPRYTVGIGGSGGGIQQYVYGQNHPGLIDAAIPQYSYPDMTTQTIHVGDCELLEHYMDVTDAANPRWDDWDNRKIIEGQNSIEGFTSSWQARMGATGSSECIEGWRGSTPLAMNPTFGLADGEDTAVLAYLPEILGKISAGLPAYPDDFPDLGRLLRTHEDPDQWVEWTHWADAEEAYGENPATGMANVAWDNVGVQYGLRAVANGQITPEEFLDLNAKVGSWKESYEATPESCGLVEAMAGAEVVALGKLVGLCEGDELDAYSSRQMDLSSDPNVPAPRRSADVDGIRGAFESGLVFSGDMPREIPILDARHYLEDELDMHNAQQSFGVRERIIRAAGDADNQLIWFLDARPSEDAAATARLYEDGFRLMDEWVANIQADPAGDVVAAKPAGAVDKCFTTDGTLIAEGDDVWSGAAELVESGAGAWSTEAPTEVDGVPVGACADHFPLHSTSRIVAGGPITGDVYKCHTKSVTQAVADGEYGSWVPTGADIDRLEEIFPNGVCDYAKPSVGDPSLPSYVARYSEQQCASMAKVADRLGAATMQEMIKYGLLALGAVTDQSGPATSPPPSPARPACEVVVTWEPDEVERVEEIAADWGVSVDRMHDGGGQLMFILVVQAVLQARQAIP